jgi:hypothetical protein
MRRRYYRTDRAAMVSCVYSKLGHPNYDLPYIFQIGGRIVEDAWWISELSEDVMLGHSPHFTTWSAPL